MLLILKAFLALFLALSVASVPYGTPSHDTNAARLARGLAPNKPARLHDPTKVQARQAGGSPLPPRPQEGVIQVTPGVSTRKRFVIAQPAQYLMLVGDRLVVTTDFTMATHFTIPGPAPQQSATVTFTNAAPYPALGLGAFSKATSGYMNAYLVSTALPNGQWDISATGVLSRVYSHYLAPGPYTPAWFTWKYAGSSYVGGARDATELPSNNPSMYTDIVRVTYKFVPVVYFE